MTLRNTINSITISIIIPTLNSARTLKDCLDSIAIQDYPKDKIEIIIADGGSTDDTMAIINSTNPTNILAAKLEKQPH